MCDLVWMGVFSKCFCFFLFCLIEFSYSDCNIVRLVEICLFLDCLVVINW